MALPPEQMENAVRDGSLIDPLCRSPK